MFDIYFFLLLFPIGFFVGQYLEWRHYQSIQKREEKLVGLVATSSKEPIGKFSHIRDIRLAQGSAVISVDYFKRILAALRGFFGGNVRSYETLLDRARREAVLRLKESSSGAAEIVNLRIETSSIYKGKGNQIGSVEVFAYATAIYI